MRMKGGYAYRIDFPVKNVSVYVQSLIFQLPDARGSEQESSD
jgi:hypothetical protein